MARAILITRLGSARNRYWRSRFLAQVWGWQAQVQLAEQVKFAHPVNFQGRGRLVIEAEVTFGYALANARALPIVLQPREPQACISIGRGTSIINGTEIMARQSIIIGQNCLIGARTFITDSDFHGLPPDQRKTPGRTQPVVMEQNVWCGTDVTILKGVRVGQDAVLGARCVVTKDVPPGAIVAGNPMRVIGSVYEL